MSALQVASIPQEGVSPFSRIVDSAVPHGYGEEYPTHIMPRQFDITTAKLTLGESDVQHDGVKHRFRDDMRERIVFYDKDGFVVNETSEPDDHGELQEYLMSVDVVGLKQPHEMSVAERFQSLGSRMHDVHFVMHLVWKPEFVSHKVIPSAHITVYTAPSGQSISTFLRAETSLRIIDTRLHSAAGAP